jgi:hypothetical protein
MHENKQYVTVNFYIQIGLDVSIGFPFHTSEISNSFLVTKNNRVYKRSFSEPANCVEIFMS